MKLLDLNLLGALDALLAEESVTVAAKRMHLSTPAMSHTLARIRDAMNDPILVRAGRRLRPTPRALELREPLRRLIADARALLSSEKGARLEELERTFVLRAPDAVPTVYGPTLLAELHTVMRRASLRFVAESDGDALALRDGGIDLDIGSIDEGGPEIRREPLYQQRLVGVVRTGHRLGRGKVTAKRFAAELHVVSTQRGASVGRVDAALLAAGLRRAIALAVPSPYAALMAASRSELVATAPARLADAVKQRLGLRVFALPMAVPADEVVLAWHPRFAADPAHAFVRACVVKILGQPFAGRSSRAW
jgi:DNA-binding transcriptional LysR family regulator